MEMMDWLSHNGQQLHAMLHPRDTGDTESLPIPRLPSANCKVSDCNNFF